MHCKPLTVSPHPKPTPVSVRAHRMSASCRAAASGFSAATSPRPSGPISAPRPRIVAVTGSASGGRCSPPPCSCYLIRGLSSSLCLYVKIFNARGRREAAQGAGALSVERLGQPWGDVNEPFGSQTPTRPAPSCRLCAPPGPRGNPGQRRATPGRQGSEPSRRCYDAGVGKPPPPRGRVACGRGPAVHPGVDEHEHFVPPHRTRKGGPGVARGLVWSRRGGRGLASSSVGL